MRNRNMPAKPIVNECGFPSHDTVLMNNKQCTGLTKLEYAAIQIMACASSNSDFAAMTHKEQSKWVINQANALFDELEEQ